VSRAWLDIVYSRPCSPKGNTPVARSEDTVFKPGDYTSMSYSISAEQTVAAATVLAKPGVGPGERVLIMLSDGPGFAEAFAGIIEHQALPLPVNPLLAAPDIIAAATKTGAGVLVASLEQIHTLTDLGTEPPVLIDGAQGPWAAVLRLCSVSNKFTASGWCCCHTTPAAHDEPGPTTAAHRKDHRHKPTVTTVIGPNREVCGLGLWWPTATPSISHRECRSAAV
jgi:acyl-coenzyme A synthetase/AMP-(fatty) acid ligase